VKQVCKLLDGQMIYYGYYEINYIFVIRRAKNTFNICKFSTPNWHLCQALLMPIIYFCSSVILQINSLSQIRFGRDISPSTLIGLIEKYSCGHQNRRLLASMQHGVYSCDMAATLQIKETWLLGSINHCVS